GMSTQTHFPDAFTVNGHQILSSTTQSCNVEAQLGLAMFPSHHIIHSTPSIYSPPPSPLAVVVDGPAIAKVELRWKVHTDSMNAADIDGRSTFTFTPDGRVVRFDRIGAPTAVMDAGTSMCVGGGSSTFFVTSFMTVENGFATDLRTETGSVQ